VRSHNGDIIREARSCRRSWQFSADGFIDQYIEAFRKVTAGYELLL